MGHPTNDLIRQNSFGKWVFADQSMSEAFTHACMRQGTAEATSFDGFEFHYQGATYRVSGQITPSWDWDGWDTLTCERV